MDELIIPNSIYQTSGLCKIILNYVVDQKEIVNSSTNIKLLKWFKNAMPIDYLIFNHNWFLEDVAVNGNMEMFIWASEEFDWKIIDYQHVVDRLGYIMKSGEHVKILIWIIKFINNKFSDDPVNIKICINCCSWNEDYSGSRSIFIRASKLVDINILDEFIKTYKMDQYELNMLVSHAIFDGTLELVKYLFTKYKIDEEYFNDFDKLIMGVKNNCNIEIKNWILQKFKRIDGSSMDKIE